jgi:adenosylmethionine---8-amino-7-oxononanoate aminotransferase
MAAAFQEKLNWIEKDRRFIWHPFTQMQTAADPIFITHGKGSYLYSEDGRSYLDGNSSWWVNLHGHAHPYIANKIKEQLDQLEHVIFAGFTHRPAIELAERLLSILPVNMSKVYYSDNGSTAVEVALKIALQYGFNRNLPKEKILCFKKSYHGDTLGGMSASGKNEFNKPFWNFLYEVESVPPPIVGQEETTLQAMECILKKGETACFIFEPLVLGSGGMIIYPAQALDALLRLCKKYQVIAIADEVMTGFGRTGTLFACDQLQEKPDIVCLSKGLTGGFLPLGITACAEYIYREFLGVNLQKALLHGHSYTANPLACTSALASLDLLLTPDCTLQRMRIQKSHAVFCEHFKKNQKIRRCESLGTILAIEFITEGETSYYDLLRDQLYDFFLKEGILLRPLGNVLYVMPPYCITEKELEWIYNLIMRFYEDY